MTILRAQTGNSASSKATTVSQSQWTDCRKLSPARGRKVHALIRASSQRDVQHGQSAQVHYSSDRQRLKDFHGHISKRRKEEKGQIKAIPQQQSWIPLIAGAAIPLLIGGPAWAAYSPAEGEQVLKNVAGAAYIILVCFFFYRLIKKRAYTGVTQSFRSQANELAEEPEEVELQAAPKDATPISAMWGAFQAGVIAYLLFQLCGLIDGYFDRQEVPDQYTAHNITVTLRTVIRGLAYLMTFLFGANCLGLSGLAVQLALFPDIEKAEDVKQE